MVRCALLERSYEDWEKTLRSARVKKTLDDKPPMDKREAYLRSKVFTPRVANSKKFEASSIPSDTIIGKPNILYSFTGVEHGHYRTRQLDGMTVEEFVASAEQMAEDPVVSAKYQKILAQIAKDEENEYNRTKVEDRYGSLINSGRREQCHLNATRSPRIIETLDGQSFKSDSYQSKKLRKNA